jgi:hypothetical protein
MSKPLIEILTLAGLLDEGDNMTSKPKKRGGIRNPPGGAPRKGHKKFFCYLPEETIELFDKERGKLTRGEFFTLMWANWKISKSNEDAQIAHDIAHNDDLRAPGEKSKPLAQLFAAAPDLLAACEAELEVYAGMDVTTLMPKTLARISALRAAVARARGE